MTASFRRPPLSTMPRSRRPLVIVGELDLIVPAAAVRQAAARYRHGTSLEVPNTGRMVFSGAALAVTMGLIDDWLATADASPGTR